MEDSSEIHTTATMSQRETHHRFDSVQGAFGRVLEWVARNACWGVSSRGGGAMFWSSSYPSFQDKAWQPAGTQNRRDGEGQVAKAAPRIHSGSSPRRTLKGHLPITWNCLRVVTPTSARSTNCKAREQRLGEYPKAEVPQRHFNASEVMSFILGIICPNVQLSHSSQTQNTRLSIFLKLDWFFLQSTSLFLLVFLFFSLYFKISIHCFFHLVV